MVVLPFLMIDPMLFERLGLQGSVALSRREAMPVALSQRACVGNPLSR